MFFITIIYLLEIREETSAPAVGALWVVNNIQTVRRCFSLCFDNILIFQGKLIHWNMIGMLVLDIIIVSNYDYDTEAGSVGIHTTEYPQM